MRLFWGILGLLLLTLPARADTIYDVSGTATITGNDVCGGQCVETVNFDFSLDEFFDPTFNTYDFSVLPGETGSVSGPLPFTFAEPNGGKLPWDRYGYVAWYAGAFGDRSEFDIGVTCGQTNPEPCTPVLEWPFLYACAAGTCLNDFGWDSLATVTGTVTDPMATPEPQTWAMLWIGLVGLALMKFAARGKQLKASLPLVFCPTAQPGHL